MPSNIKIKSLARSAGKTVDGSGNPTAAVSGSDMANFFLTGDINQSVYRHVPDNVAGGTVGSISGTSPRPIGDQYQFYEFDGVVPSIIFNTISTISDNTDVNIGRRISFTFTTTGVVSTNYNVKLYGYDANQQNESLLDTYSGYSGNVTSEAKTFTGTLFPNQINFFKLLLTTTSGPTRYGEDITSIYIYPIDLTISSVVLSPTFTGAGTYNYTTGSVGFTVNVNGGVSPYFYNFNGAGYGAADVNTSTFNNSSTTVQDAYDILVKDSKSPTFDTATNTPTTFRPPIRVSAISTNSSPEPYVDFTITPTIANNTDGLPLVYAWALDGTTPSTSTTASPTVYYTSLGAKTHRVDITNSTNSSIRHNNTAAVTVAMIAPGFTSVAYTPSSETFSISLNVSSLGTARSGTTRKFDIEYRVKDSGGTYGSWTSITSDSTSTSTSVSISGKTDTTQVVQAKARTKRSNGITEFNSSYAESTEVTIPQKGIVNMDNQTSLLTGGDRSFDGSVTIGGVADTGYNTPTITAVTTDGTVTASISKPSSNIVRVVVNNPCTSLNDGTASHVISLKDGNGYNLTKSFSTQYKISSTSINLTASWENERYYNGARNSIANSLGQYSFTLNSFAYKVGDGSYTTLNNGNMSSSFFHNYTAPTTDQVWTYRIVASGGTYTASDTTEKTVDVYGYPGQSYTYSIAGFPSSGTLSQMTNVVARISRSSGNFAKISVNSYYVTRPTGTNVSPPEKLAANISDSATSFDSDAFSLYDSAECGNNVVGVGTLQAYLKYAINDSLYYLHLIQAPSITVSNEPASITSTLISGITSGFAIRGTNIIHEVSYSSWGPPLSGYYDFDGTSYDNSAYAYLSQNTDPSSFTGTTVSDENAPFYTPYGYYRIFEDGTFCRKTRSVSFGYVPNDSVGTDITLTYYGRAYRIVENAISEGPGLFTYTYNYSFNGNDSTVSSSKTYTVRGRRLNASLCSWSITIYKDKGLSLIEFGLGSGTLTGPDGVIDYYSGNIDGLTYVYQRYNGTSWVDITGSSYDPGTFGTTLVRVKFTDTWGTEFTSAQQSATTEDLDYTFTLSHENNSPIIYGYVGPSQATAPVIVNPSAISNYVNTSFSSGTSVTLNNLPPNTIVFAGEHAVGSMDEKGTYLNFNGAYTTISVSVTAGSTPSYGMFRTFTYTLTTNEQVKATRDYAGSPYANASGTDILGIKSFQMFNSGDSIGNATLFGTGGISGNFRLMAILKAPSVYGATATYTLHGQKASNNAQQGTDYYIVLTTASETNQITLTQISTSCDTIGVRAATGTLTSANKIIIQTSTDNSTWTDAHTITSIAANTNYDRSITGIASVIYVRALLYETTTLKTTSSTLTYTRYTPVANNSASNYSVIALATLCSSFSYRVNRPTSSDSNTNNYYNIDWYTADEYGTTTYITSAYTRSYNTTYSGQSLTGFFCDVLIRAVITPFSITGCIGTAWDSMDQIYKSDSINANCNCAGGGGEGCLVYGTMVEMGDGTFKKVEDLELGEVVKSLSIKDLDTNIEDNWKEFYTADFEYEEGLSVITNISDNSFEEYYIINNNLKLTFEHPIFIKRAEVFMFTQTENLVIGDYIFKVNGQFELITSIDIIGDYVQTININIEENDVYFADGILVHNLPPPKE